MLKTLELLDNVAKAMQQLNQNWTTSDMHDTLNILARPVFGRCFDELTYDVTRMASDARDIYCEMSESFAIAEIEADEAQLKSEDDENLFDELYRIDNRMEERWLDAWKEGGYETMDFIPTRLDLFISEQLENEESK